MIKLNTIFKILISFTLLWLVLRQIDVNQLVSVIQKANLFWVLLSLFFYLLIILVGVVRLSIILDPGSKRRPGYLSLLEVYWIGMFFSLVLPGQVTGDVVKAYKLTNRSGKAVESATAVIMDKMIGMTSMVFLASLVLALGFYSLDLSLAGRSVVILLLACAIFYFVIFNRGLARRLGFLTQLFKRLKLDRLLRDIYFSFNIYRHHLDILGKAFLISLITSLMTFIGSYFLGRAVGIDLPLVSFFILIPLISVISVLPISISGVGLQDGAYVYFFTQLGVDPARALGMSLLSHILRFTVSSFGGIVYLNERK